MKKAKLLILVLLITISGTIIINADVMPFDRASAVSGYIDSVVVHQSGMIEVFIKASDVEGQIYSNDNGYELGSRSKNVGSFLIKDNAPYKNGMLASLYLALSLKKKILIRLNGEITNDWSVVSYTRIFADY